MPQSDGNESTEAPTPAEIRSYLADAKVQKLFSEVLEECGVDRFQRSQFEKDLDTLLFHEVNLDWHKARRPEHPEVAAVKARNDQSSFKIRLKVDDLPRRLPFRPLRRMAGFIGAKNLRAIFRLSRPVGDSKYIVLVRERLPKEKSDKGRSHKRYEKEKFAEDFGQAVLRFESLGLSRDEAQKMAGLELRVIKGTRQLERDMRAFKQLCQAKGYVPNKPLLSGVGLPPSRSISSLDAPVGAKKKK